MRRTQLAEFMRRMEPDSIAIIASAPERTRSNDTEYRYRQDSDFYYLTGFNEPESIAVIAPAHAEHKYTLFVRPRDPEKPCPRQTPRPRLRRLRVGRPKSRVPDRVGAQRACTCAPRARAR